MGAGNGLESSGHLDVQTFISQVILLITRRNALFRNIIALSIKAREGGDIGLIITLVPKVFNIVFLSVGLKTLGLYEF